MVRSRLFHKPEISIFDSMNEFHVALFCHQPLISRRGLKIICGCAFYRRRFAGNLSVNTVLSPNYVTNMWWTEKKEEKKQNQINAATKSQRISMELQLQQQRTEEKNRPRHFLNEWKNAFDFLWMASEQQPKQKRKNPRANICRRWENKTKITVWLGSIKIGQSVNGNGCGDV